MSALQSLLIGTAVGMVPIGIALYVWTISTIRRLQPEVLDEVDPNGFRPMYGPSQLRFTRYILSRRYRRFSRGRVVVACEANFWLVVSYYLLLAAIAISFLL